MFCNNCGKKIQDNSQFCGYCGTNLIKQQNNIQTEMYNKKIEDDKSANIVLIAVGIIFLAIAIFMTVKNFNKVTDIIQTMFDVIRLIFN